MISKLAEKKRAVSLRRKGLTYSEILREVSVAKSTLSLWLQEVGIAKRQKQRITQKRIDAAKRGAEARRRNRIQITNKIYKEAEEEIGNISLRELWLIGIALYWAEGTKEKEYIGGSRLAQFSNSDPKMIKLYLKWLFDICRVRREEVQFGLYIHENSRRRIHSVIEHWSKCTEFPKNAFSYIYFKKHNPQTKRKNIGDYYFGNLKVTVRASIGFNRKIAGWVRGINKGY